MALGFGLPKVGKVNAAAFDVLSRLTFGGGKLGEDEQFDERRAVAIELGTGEFAGGDFAE